MRNDRVVWLGSGQQSARMSVLSPEEEAASGRLEWPVPGRYPETLTNLCSPSFRMHHILHPNADVLSSGHYDGSEERWLLCL